jgi:hypothetical protein
MGIGGRPAATKGRLAGVGRMNERRLVAYARPKAALPLSTNTASSLPYERMAISVLVEWLDGRNGRGSGTVGLPTF